MLTLLRSVRATAGPRQAISVTGLHRDQLLAKKKEEGLRSKRGSRAAISCARMSATKIREKLRKITYIHANYSIMIYYASTCEVRVFVSCSCARPEMALPRTGCPKWSCDLSAEVNESFQLPETERSRGSLQDSLQDSVELFGAAKYGS